MIYVSSSCLKGKYISEVVSRLAESGIRNIELSGGTERYPGLEEDLIRLKRRYGLVYACHAYFPPQKDAIVVNLASCDDDIYRKTLTHYEDCIRLMEKLDCKTLSVHAGFMIRIDAQEIGRRLRSTVVYDEKMAYDRFCSAYGYINDLCQKRGITLYLENNVLSEENHRQFHGHSYLMMTDHDSIMRMKQKMDFNLLLDLGHLHVSADTLQLDFQEECGALKKDVRWFHVSENDGRTDQHLPMKEESAILDALKRMYVKGTDITLETMGDMDGIKESMRCIDRILR